MIAHSTSFEPTFLLDFRLAISPTLFALTFELAEVDQKVGLYIYIFVYIISYHSFYFSYERLLKQGIIVEGGKRLEYTR